jgi:hypothetical protein
MHLAYQKTSLLSYLCLPHRFRHVALYYTTMHDSTTPTKSRARAPTTTTTTTTGAHLPHKCRMIEYTNGTILSLWASSIGKGFVGPTGPNAIVSFPRFLENTLCHFCPHATHVAQLLQVHHSTVGISAVHFDIVSCARTVSGSTLTRPDRIRALSGTFPYTS